MKIGYSFNDTPMKKKRGKVLMEIERDKHPDQYGRDIIVRISYDGFYWSGTPYLSLEDLKELRKTIRKYIKQHSEK